MKKILPQEFSTLLDLARITVSKNTEDRMTQDLQNILHYFEELTTVATDHVQPMTGGIFHTNEFRNDTTESIVTNESARAAFPKTDNGFLEVPGVF